jgi:hypothetical protein
VRVHLILSATLVAFLSACSTQPSHSARPSSPPPTPVQAAPPVTEGEPGNSFSVSGHTPLGGVHPGDILALSGVDDMDQTPYDADPIEPAVFSNYLSVRLPGSADVRQGVKVEAIDNGGISYETSVAYDRITGTEELGYTFDVGFENKPWSDTENWIMRVYCGTEQVLEQLVTVHPLDLLIYEDASDNPFQETNAKTLYRGRTYKIVYPAYDGSALIIYYTKEYWEPYKAVYLGKADSPSTTGMAFDLRVSDGATSGQYLFKVGSAYGMDQTTQRVPAFDWHDVESVYEPRT